MYNGTYISGSGNHASTATTGPRAKCDQVVFEALCKACEVIVGARSNNGNSETTRSTAAATNSSRFNLQIPEVAGVRSILSQHRLQLYVPVRLDVFFQHADGSRELLERWCLEYKTVSSERFLQVEGVVTNDPMVQLTHVCKRVVLWLRTLYCWARLLPAHTVGTHTSRQVGFSIYVHADYSDDITDLVTNQGFVSASQRGVGVVTTPYGELGWQVVHCAASKLERLIPTKVPLGISTRARQPASQPIPMKQPTDERQQRWSQQYFAPRSAPANRPPTYTERSQQKRLEAQKQQQQSFEPSPQQPRPPAIQHQQRGMSYDPIRTIHRSATGVTEPQLYPHHQHPPSILRSHTTLDDLSSPRRTAPPMPSTDNPPERVLSGLSLALMMASNDDDNPHYKNSPKARTAAREGKDSLGGMSSEEATVVEKVRRAALHEMPPHLLEQQQAPPPGAVAPPHSAAMSGDYGYGYNNHIPWQKIHPSSSNPALVVQDQQSQLALGFGRTLSTSPASLASSLHGTSSSPQHTFSLMAQTPPGAAFLGATPPMGNGGVSGNGLGQFIPPRSSNNNSNRLESKSITPPFQPRPAGFLHEPPTLYLEQPATSSTRTTEGADGLSGNKAVAKAPVASLDSLRSSPFQQQNVLSLHPESRSFMMSSLSFVPTLGSASHLTAHGASFVGGGAGERSLWGGASGAVMPSSLAGSAGLQQHPLFQQSEDYYSEEMPFAVELPPSFSTLGLAGASPSKSGTVATRPSASSYLGNSSALTTLAQKCAAPQQRLKLLEKSHLETEAGGTHAPDDGRERPDSNAALSSLADQLNEFRTFGASLHMSDLDTSHGAADEHLSAASSTSTPISLRT
jgi:Autophagy-related protein 13